MINITMRSATRLRAARPHPGRPHPGRPHDWHLAAGLTGVVAGAVVVTGTFLPWVETFAGLIGFPGIRGGNGRLLAAAGVLIAAAGLYHLLRGGSRSRWLVGLGGFAALGFSGYLLIQLAATLRTLGSDSMVLARGAPGLWVVAGGSLLAFGTLFLPTATAAGRISGRAVPAAGLAGPTAAPATSVGGPAEPAAGPARPAAPRARADRLRRSVLAGTADLGSQGARRGLQIALGLLWLLDAALQLQPVMFRSGFGGMLGDTAAGNPAVLASPILWASHLVGQDTVPWNTTFALIQLAIAAGLLWRPTVKAALAGSIAWSLTVWWFGEGLGGVLTGTASPVTGAPGAVILYALIAALAWPTVAGAGRDSVAGRSLPGSRSLPGGRWGKGAWLLLWAGFAYLILQPAVRAPRALSDAIAAGAAGEPGWLAAIDHATASAIGSHGTAACAVLAALFILIAAGILHPATARPAVVLAGAAGLAIWVAAENLGQIFTGMATDPNTGPLLVLLAVAYWPPRQAPERAAAAYGRALGPVLASPGPNR